MLLREDLEFTSLTERNPMADPRKLAKQMDYHSHVTNTKHWDKRIHCCFTLKK